jgi:KDO2-lipid IV(A) lauroyltransferase
MLYYLLTGLSALVSSLPAGPLQFFFWHLFGGLYEVSPKRKRIIQKNFRTLFPEKSDAEIKQISKNSFRHYGVLIHEFLLSSNLRGTKKIKFNINEREEYLQSAFASTKEGIILVSGHFGNWDLGGHYLLRFSGSKKVSVMADSLGGGYGRFVKSTREKLGVGVIDSTKEIKKAYQALKNGEIVVIVFDRPLKGEPNVVFNGVPMRFPEGVARLALETGAACIFGAAYREPCDFIHAFSDELFNPTTLKMDRKQLMQKLAESFWKLIEKHPEQWYLFRDIKG